MRIELIMKKNVTFLQNVDAC